MPDIFPIGTIVLIFLVKAVYSMPGEIFGISTMVLIYLVEAVYLAIIAPSVLMLWLLFCINAPLS